MRENQKKYANVPGSSSNHNDLSTRGSVVSVSVGHGAVVLPVTALLYCSTRACTCCGDSHAFGMHIGKPAGIELASAFLFATPLKTPALPVTNARTPSQLKCAIWSFVLLVWEKRPCRR